MFKAKSQFTVIIIGGGAAGTFCAIHAAKAGLDVAIIEQNDRIGSKIRVSGGGRCNHTNLYTDASAYLSQNPDFCHSALARFTQWDFLLWFEQAGLTYHEKKLGQLFCDQKSRGLIEALQSQCDQYGVRLLTKQHVESIDYDSIARQYHVKTQQADYASDALVLACGGPSFAKLGGSDLALRIAKQFGLKNIPFRPALVPLTLANPAPTLSGISTEAIVTSAKGVSFRDNILFTHKGLSGPAILQISSYWQKSEPIVINFLPGLDESFLLTDKSQKPNKKLQQAFKPFLPQSVIQYLLPNDKNDLLQHYRDHELKQLMHKLQHYRIIPIGTEGMSKAEVSTGGIDTREFNPRTFEALQQPKFYAIGEALDVTGWLGGYNFQWAWSSAWCCAQALASSSSSKRSAID